MRLSRNGAGSQQPRALCLRAPGWALLLGLGAALVSRADPLPAVTPLVPNATRQLEPRPAVTNTAQNLEQLPPITNTTQRLEQLHDNLNTNLQRVARQLDSFFRRPDEPEVFSNSTGRLRLSVLVKDAAGIAPNLAFSGKIALPYAEERLHLFVDNFKRGELPGSEQPSYDNESVQIGARLQLLEQLRSYIHLEGGIRFHGIPDPFTQVEFEYERKLDGWVGRFTEDVFYFAKERAGQLTQVDVEHPFCDMSIFRNTTAASYTEDTRGAEFQESIYFDYPLPGHCRHLIPSAGVFAHKNGPFLMDNYLANLTYRTSFFRPWLVLELTPQLEFPSEHDYHVTPSIRISLEIWLGALPKDF